MSVEVNTFSIVARCARSGDLGVGVASAVPAVGAICPYVAPGVGAVSTQSWVNPAIAVAVLAALKSGADAEQALADALADDPEAHLRQVGVVDAHGRSAAATGTACTPWHGQILGENYAVQGNMLTGEAVLAAMAGAFTKSLDAPLEERLLLALEAAQAAGGDKRGRQSAGIVVQGAEDYRRVDLRVDDHAAPVAELRRVATIASAQLAPFVAGMPKRDAPGTMPEDVRALLALSPPDRPGGGGSRLP
ncbi:DUF1028 domain-containing protein [Aureimonas sp. SA4125]|uniref:DUF1028 domain-containing protein n=1 Tax=Aureimonas sp. SA4125 TaxID=2826993 RepID=UPI001CC46940|nr:DUF1028 domain-containing protein [Aureimonas sp. SA4125]